MTKKPVFWIVVVILVAMVAVVAIWAKNYYEARYVGSDYYAMVPLDFDVTPETLYSMDGEDVGLGKEYALTAYDGQSEPRTLAFNVRVDRDTFPQPGEFLLIQASTQIVVGWRIISESEVPESALRMIRQNP
jgi:uncharacterized protein YxeA